MVAEGYRHLPRLFDEVQAKGSQEDLKAILQRVVDVVERQQDFRPARNRVCPLRRQRRV
jgi:hypothetical protein